MAEAGQKKPKKACKQGNDKVSKERERERERERKE